MLDSKPEPAKKASPYIKWTAPLNYKQILKDKINNKQLL